MRRERREGGKELGKREKREAVGREGREGREGGRDVALHII